MTNILASAISNADNLAAFDLMAKQRFGEIKLEQLLVYVIDTVDSSALPLLAEQFDVLGYRGMRLATTEAQQREVIKQAISVKRKAGTPWAIKQALRAIGYPDAVMTENAGTGPTGWAEFTIDLHLGNNGISQAQIDELLEMINIYKRGSSHLLALQYRVDFNDDAMVFTDSSVENQADDEIDSIYTGGGFLYDGSVLYDGSHNYSDDSDLITIAILP